uniref:Major facilitator superfamily (MFS) profile domain-containing protein n=1 Tax=Arion vulgaris TaxID=1028688 RepID=A0A0B6ZE32_9EUPU
MPFKKNFDKVEYYSETDKLIVHHEDARSSYSGTSLSEKDNTFVNKGNRTKTLLVTLCILVTEMCERLTYYSIVANLVLYCTSKLNIGQTDATNINQVFSGFVYLLSILGGFISDSYAGRFLTILGSSFLYIIGAVLLPASAVDYESWGWDGLTESAKTGMFIAGLVFVALGTGGIKANVGPFGAEQVGSLGKEAVQSFFNWFYWVVNVGAFIAYAGVSYVQQNVSFAWGFFIPLVSMILAVIIFVTVKSRYTRTHPNGSVLTTAWKICVQGVMKPKTKSQLLEGANLPILSRAKKSLGGDYEDHIVDGVVSVIKVTPFCLLVIMYWAIYAQMSNTFFAQSERMDVRLGDGITVPAAALNVFNTISIIILIPIVDRFVYPLFERIGRPLTYLKRMGIGMVLSVIAVCVAGIVEIYRKEFLVNSHVQVLAGQNFTSSSMSVFVQIPQFALIGASEIFTSVTTLEFAYNQAPVSMQGLLTGLFLAASGVGNWVSTAILSIVQAATEERPWWCDEINHCNMEYLLFLLGGLMFLNFLVFCFISHFYKYQDPASFEKDTTLDKKNEVQDEVQLEQEHKTENGVKMRNPSGSEHESTDESNGVIMNPVTST